MAKMTFQTYLYLCIKSTAYRENSISNAFRYSTSSFFPKRESDSYYIVILRMLLAKERGERIIFSINRFQRARFFVSYGRKFVSSSNYRFEPNQFLFVRIARIKCVPRLNLYLKASRPLSVRESIFCNASVRGAGARARARVFFFFFLPNLTA